ncbi:MAG: hypothetical protein RIT32_643 [Actinomycetota bacterium]|jgi:rhodanese-related sulfurtransferase
MRKYIALVIALMLALAGCSNSADSSVTDLSVADFASTIASEDVVILDVRTPGEFATGHIENSINIDAESGSFASEIESLDKTKTYAVYCRSGNRSGNATKIMAEAGFTSIYNMLGGTIDWTNFGFPLTTN